MHFYDLGNIHESHTLDDRRWGLWETKVPAVAFKHGFLLSALLALSALKIASERGSDASKFLSAFDRHQAVALSGFRKALSEPVTLEISDALFVTASAISISSVARSSAVAAAMPDKKHIAMEDVSHLFNLTR